MKLTALTVAIAAASISTIANAGTTDIHSHQVKVPYWGDQQRANEHFQGSINGLQDIDTHLQGSINDDRKRLDKHDAQIGDLYGNVTAVQGAAQTANDRATRLESRADAGEAHDVVQDGRIHNNSQRLDGAEGAIRETNKQVTADRNASVERDTALSGRIDERVQYDSTQDAYAEQTRQHVANVESWSVEQFNRQGAAIESNTAAISAESDARQEADRDLQAGIASAIAAGSHIMDASYQGLQMSIAGGAYRGASAASLAIGGAFNDRTFGHISVSNDSRGNQAIGGNLNFKF